MAPHLPWPEVLEEQAYLIQILSEAAHDPGALEQTSSILDVFRADLRFCTNKVAELERENRSGFVKSHESKHSSSSASRFFHRVTGSIGSDDSKFKDREEHEMQQERLLAAWTRKRIISVEVKNLEANVQLLRRRARHHEEFKQRLQALYDRIFDGDELDSPADSEVEDDIRRFQQTLQQAQKIRERHRAVMALLHQADFALSNAVPHLSAAGSGTNKPARHVELGAAKTCALQATVVAEQAKRLDPAFFEQERGSDVLKSSWLSDVFRTTTTGDGESIPVPSLSALRSHHASLRALLDIGRRRMPEYETAARQAAQRCSEARERRDAIRRRVLLKHAGAEAGVLDGELELAAALSAAATGGHARAAGDSGLEKDGTARMKDVTAGLDGILPVVVPERTSASRGDKLAPPGEERDRPRSEEGVRPAAAVSQPRATSQAQPEPRRAAASPQGDKLVPPAEERGVRRSEEGLRPLTAAVQPRVTPQTQPESRKTAVSQGDKLVPRSEERSVRRSEEGSRPVAAALQPRATPQVQTESHVPATSQGGRPVPAAEERGTLRSEGVRPAATASQSHAIPQSQLEPRVSPKVQPVPHVAPQARTPAPALMPGPAGQLRGRDQSPGLSSPPMRGSPGDPPSIQPQQSPGRAPRLTPQSSKSDLRDPSPSARGRAPSQLAPPYDVRNEPGVNLTPAPGRQPQPPIQPLESMRSSREPAQREARPIPAQDLSGRQLPQPSQANLPRVPESSPDPRAPAPSHQPSTSMPRFRDVGGQATRDSPGQTPSKLQPAIPVEQTPPHRTEVHGILKAPAEVPVARPTGDSADPWGVKAAAAPSSRSQPKLKTMFNLWRSTDGFKGDKQDKLTQSPVLVDYPEPPVPPKKSNPRSAMQKLRFVDEIQLIPRPAVDSDPYEDEDEEALPPSPQRGSIVWHQTEEGEIEGSEEGGGGWSSKGIPLRYEQESIRAQDALSTSGPPMTAPLSTPLSQYHTYPHMQSISELQPSSSAPSSSTMSPLSAASSYSDVRSLQWQEATAVPQIPTMTSAEALARQRSHQGALDDTRSPSLRRAHATLGDMVPEFTEPLRLPRTQFSVQANAGGNISNERHVREAAPPNSRNRSGSVSLQAGGNPEPAPQILPPLEPVSYDDLHLTNTWARGSSAADDMDGRARLMSPSAPNLTISTDSEARARMPNAMSMARVQPGTRTDHQLLQAIFPSPPNTSFPDRDLLFTK